MAKYRVLTKSYINSSIVEAGAIVEYEGKPGSNLEPIEPEGKGKAKAEAKESAKAEAKESGEAA
jgi:hypothetical protein